MHCIDRRYRILFAALLWLPLWVPAQDDGATKSPLDPMIELNQAGQWAESQSRYAEALQWYRRGLEFVVGDEYLHWQAVFHVNIGIVLDDLGRYQEALRHYQQALMIRRETGDRSGEGAVLTNIGVACSNLGRYQDALRNYDRALVIDRETGERRREGAVLSNIGNVSVHLGRYQDALDNYKQALTIDRALADRLGEGISSINIGVVFSHLGRYQEALSRYDQALTIMREVGDRRGEGMVLGNMGIVYGNLGRSQEALSRHQQALVIGRALGDRQGEGEILANIGDVYRRLGRHRDALDHHRQALVIRREIGDRRGEGEDLHSIGLVLDELDRNQEARSHYEQALVVHQEIGDRAGESMDLLGLGVLDAKGGNTTGALSNYREALIIEAEVGRPETIWRLWDKLRRLWSAAGRPGPAIIAGKRAVNAIQRMREASSGLDHSMQKGFLEDKEDVYRGLADELIGQGRIPEAEQVLAMLKEEELYDYIRRRDGAEGIRDTRASLTPAEHAWNDRYERFRTDLVALGSEYRDLKAIKDRSSAEQARHDALKTELKDAQRALRVLLAALADEFRDAGGERALAHSDAALKQLRGQQHTLREMGHGAVIISTIMAEERLNLILTTPDVQLARQAPIGFKALSDRINAFRAVLKDPQADPLPLARELYGHLIAPLAADLEQAGAETLMISLDGPLRYIPLAALHDGEQWLIERWRIAVYNKATADKLSAERIGNWQVAGLGVSKAHPPFQALDAVPGELEGIVKRDADDTDGVIAGRVYLDADFDAKRLIEVLEAQDDYPVLHLASHFSLNPGDTSASFLLLGDGSRLSLDDIDTDPDYELFGIDLLTLSACDTAMGAGSGAGAEIESFGALAQLRGARGVLATLWPVDDASTGELMQMFYRLRGTDAGLTKAEALRRAQLSLLKGSDSAQSCRETRGPVFLMGKGDHAARRSLDPACRYAHPYFWAPFILIGHWL